MSMPPEAALRQAEILALRQLSDALAVLNRTVEKLDTRMGEVRDKVIQFEAQDLKNTLSAMRSEVSNVVKDLRDDHEKRLDSAEKDLRAQGQRLANLQGRIVPIAALGSALLAGLLSFVTAILLKGHV